MAESTLKQKREERRSRRQQPVKAVTTTQQETEAEAAENKAITPKKGVATPGRRAAEVAEQKKEEGNIITRPLFAIREYVEGVQEEMQKVAWPTREETTHLTYIVTGVTLASALVLGLLSFAFTYLFELGLTQPLVFIGVFVVFLLLLFAYARVSQNTSSNF
ncbi:MAG: preprotein translocase subunit SecE [Phototrophicaceae bacterium]